MKDDPSAWTSCAVRAQIRAPLGLPGVRDGLPPLSAVSAARVEQRALLCVTRRAVPRT